MRAAPNMKNLGLREVQGLGSFGNHDLATDALAGNVANLTVGGEGVRVTLNLNAGAIDDRVGAAKVTEDDGLRTRPERASGGCIHVGCLDVG